MGKLQFLRHTSLVVSVAVISGIFVISGTASAVTRGEQGNGHSNSPAISSNGVWVSFEAGASNLVNGDTNGVWDVFVHSRSTGETLRVSKSSSGEQANCGGDHGSNSATSLSADGRYVAFSSCASNLVPGDSNAADDVFVHDRATGTTTRESVGPTGAQAPKGGWLGEISADGRYVLFTTSSSLVPEDTNANYDAYLRDRNAGTTTLVSRSMSGTSGNSASFGEALTPNGRFVLLDSFASDLTSGDTNGQQDVFVKDLQSGTTTRESRTSGNAQITDNSSEGTDLSDDGRFVIFQSGSSQVVPGDSNATSDVFVRDRNAGSTRAVSASLSGTIGNEASMNGSISGNGFYIAFWSRASNLTSGDTNGLADIFVTPTSGAWIGRVSNGAGGTQANAESYLPMTKDGRLVTFASEASNLVVGDTNGFRDVFTADTESFAVTRESLGWVNASPSVDLAVNPSQGTTSTTFEAVVTGSDPDGDPLTYSVTWGDGATTSGSRSTHRYAKAGEYEVTVIATDPSGSRVSDSELVRVCNAEVGGVCDPEPPKNASPEQLQEWVRNTAEETPLYPSLADVMAAGMEARDQLGLGPYETLTRDERDHVLGLADQLLVDQAAGTTEPITGPLVSALWQTGDSNSGGSLSNISGAEARLCAAEPFDCARAAGARPDAYEWADRKYPRMASGRPNKKNAFLHCMWSALMTKRANSDFAERMGNAHEEGHPNGRRYERMDLWNNMHGREVGRDGENRSDDWMADRCKALAENGTLISSLNDPRIN